MSEERMQAAFNRWFQGYALVEEPSPFDGFKKGWEAALRHLDPLTIRCPHHRSIECTKCELAALQAADEVDATP